MAEEEKPTTTCTPKPTPDDLLQTPTPPAKFDPTRMIGIIKRKALIKDLAAAYHNECISYCRELLELQKRKGEPFLYTKAPEDLRKETLRSSSKRAKKKR
ncbi:Uncharacterized protein HA466_0285770 [Hirschfeldia incana]|nr:Uncharacterized protein HA466_0285770 [Hirschfeldia incana]